MSLYADTSFLVAVYSLESESAKALTWMQRARQSLPFTPLHRLELRNALRLRVFRSEITTDQRNQSFQDLESDLDANILAHTSIPWTDAFRESEATGEGHCERMGVRSIDLLHVGLARALNSKEFLTFDLRQASLAKAVGLKVMP
jgi:predicted nucleic acid-binding protein